MVKILGVPVPPLDRVLAGVAVAAQDLDRLLGHPDRGLPATSLDMDPSARSNGLPWRAIHAARQVSSRAASTAAAMSASWNATPWLAPTGLPNCTRVCTYSAAYSTAARPTPTAIAATDGRDASNVFIAACSPPRPPSRTRASRRSSF